MKVVIRYIYERYQLFTKYRYTSTRYNPDWKLLEIMITRLDDSDNVIDRHYYEVTEEENENTRSNS
jgi:hypothetical protein